MKSDLSNVDSKAIDALLGRVEDNSHIVDNIVRDIIKPYIEDLDNYVIFIKNCLKSGGPPPGAKPILAASLRAPRWAQPAQVVRGLLRGPGE